MTVTTSNVSVDRTGDGAILVFSYDFKTQATSDLVVYVNNVLQVNPTNFSATRNSNGVGGNITFVAAPANLAAIIITRTVPLTQGTALPVQGNIPEITMENMFDKLTLMVQQIFRRTLSLPANLATTVSTDLPAPDPLKVLRWNAGGTAIENTAAGGSVSGPGVSTDNRFAIWSGASGQLLKDGPVVGAAGTVPISNGLGAVAFGPVTSAAGGDVIGPAVTTANSITLWSDASGNILKDGPALGLAGKVLESQGAGVPPSMEWPDIFGGAGRRTCPTSGALTGDYEHDGDWTTTGVITATRFRLLVRGNVSIQHNITAATEMQGGLAGANQNSHSFPGFGLGGGGGALFFLAANPPAGAGGGFGGAGGKGGSYGANDFGPRGGRNYDIAHSLCGSGGGAGAFWTTAAGVGGNGGGGIYLEVTGSITIGSSATISAVGTAGTAGGGASSGGGGGGSGGGVDMRCGGAWTLGVGSTITVGGGAGGNGGSIQGAAGGGGGGGYVFIRSGGAATASGTITISGGAAGVPVGPAANQTAGSAGVSDIVGGATFPRRTAP